MFNFSNFTYFRCFPFSLILCDFIFILNFCILNFLIHSSSIKKPPTFSTTITVNILQYFSPVEDRKTLTIVILVPVSHRVIINSFILVQNILAFTFFFSKTFLTLHLYPNLGPSPFHEMCTLPFFCAHVSQYSCPNSA